MQTASCLASTEKMAGWHNFGNHTSKPTDMKTLTRPAFTLAMVGTALIIIGLVAMPTYEIGTYIMYAGILLAGIFWIWAIWDVIAADDLKYFQKVLWLLIVASVPVLGGLIFYLIHQRVNKIVT